VNLFDLNLGASFLCCAIIVKIYSYVTGIRRESLSVKSVALL